MQRTKLNPHLKERIYVALLMAVAVTLPLSILANGISIFAILAFLVWTGDIRNISTAFTSKSNLLLPGLFAFYVLGVTYSTDQETGFQELEKKLALIAFPFIFACIPTLSQKNKRTVLLLFAFTMVALGLICLGNAARLNYLDGFTIHRLYESVFEHKYRDTVFPFFNYWYFTYDFLSKPIGIHPIYFSMYINLSIIILYLYENWLPKIIKAGILSFQFLILLLLSSRTQFAVGLLITLYFLINDLRQKKYLFMVGISLLVFSLSFMVFKYNPLAKLRISEALDLNHDYHHNQYGGRSLRMKKWACALIVWERNPIFGTGTGGDNVALKAVYKEQNFMEGYRANYNAHNQYLQILMGLGLVGLLYFLFVLFTLFKESVSTGNQLFTFFILLFAISVLTESMFSVQKGIVFFSFFTGLIGYRTKETES